MLFSLCCPLLPFSSAFFHMTPPCVSAHLAVIAFLSFNFSPWPPFLPDDFLSPVSILHISTHCGFPSCLHLTVSPSLPPLPPFLFAPHAPLCLFLSEPDLGLLISGWGALLWFLPPAPLLFAPPLLFQLFIYIVKDGGRAVRMDWWMTWEGMGEGIWAFDGRSCQSGY